MKFGARSFTCIAFAGLGLLGIGSGAHAERALITQAIDENRLVPLEGNTRPEVGTATDRGAVADSMALDHMMLLLRRAPEQEAALDRMIDALHDPASPQYHHWLEAAQVGTGYGPVSSDRTTITRWLAARGLRVNFVSANGMAIDFSGTAGQLRAAFHTELHRLDVAGEQHVANISDPRIPAALAPAIVGIVTLNDFRPRSQSEAQPDFAHSCASGSGTCQAVAPADLATIYNFNPLFAAGITGKGQTIAVVNDSNAANLADWKTFRKTYGLAGHTGGTLALLHPQPPRGAHNCSNPGLTVGENEAILDSEWSSAAAPDAHILLATCKYTTTQDGLLAAVMNLEERGAASRPQIISISYGVCETFLGAAANAAYKMAYQTGVAGGISIFVSGGDQLGDACDHNAPAAATHGLTVNGHASTPYNVAVGGTDFADTYHEDVGRYWSNANSAIFKTAKSYIPEIPWNGSCASELFVKFYGFTTSYGAHGLCNSPLSAKHDLARLVGGGGGTSGCATGSSALGMAVNGTCAGYPRPSWQTGVPGLPANRLRNMPDVSIFASAGIWNHSYVTCATNLGGCTAGHGGTSFGSPIMAGVQALVNQKMKASRGEGNPNVAYYKLAAKEYATPAGRNACNASKGNAVGKSCVFHDVTEGDNDGPCVAGSPDCFRPSGKYGVLSQSKSAYRPAFETTAGWDFATGLGSPNVTNLVEAWHTVEP